MRKKRSTAGPNIWPGVTGVLGEGWSGLLGRAHVGGCWSPSPLVAAHVVGDLLPLTQDVIADALYVGPVEEQIASARLSPLRQDEAESPVANQLLDCAV